MKYPLLAGLLAGCCLRVAAMEPVPALPRATPESQGISSAALLPLLEEAEQRKLGVHSLMIVRHGRVVAEGWWGPYAAPEPHVMFSLSKSFTSTAIGLLDAEGRLSINDPILKYFPDEAPAAPSENLRNMRIRDLLAMSTGQHKEDVDKINVNAPDQTGTRQFLAAPVAHKPGTHFFYNSPGTFMLSAIVQKVTGQTVRDFLTPRLFEPLGIPTPEWDVTPQGINLGASGLHLRTEDIAKFGQLYLQRGEWNGRRLLPAAWIDQATSRQTSNGSNPESDWDQGYGYQFWRCIPGFYRGDGAFGQFCIVMPQYDTVVAITSGTNDMAGVMKLLWKRLLPELRPAALPADDAAVAKLREKLSSLRLPVVAGENTNATAARISGKAFRFESNPLKLESLTGNFTGPAANFAVAIDGHNHAFSATAGTWTTGPAFPLGDSPTPIAATGAWTSADTYTLKLAYYQTPFILTATLRFAGGELQLEQAMNVGFGPTKPAPLTGKMQ